MRTNAAVVPSQVLPKEGVTPEFTRLFASLFDTSFETTRKSTVGRDGPNSCFCPICVRVVSAPHFKPRRVAPADKKRSRQLRQDYLLELGERLGLLLDYEEVDRLIDSPSALGVDVALATHGWGLVARSETGLGDPGLLPLWRLFAWEQGRPRRGFTLAADAILEAERRIVAALEEDSRGS